MSGDYPHDWYVPGPRAGTTKASGLAYRCGCSPTYGQSCRRCDGTAADEWELSADIRRAERARERAMRTDASYRQHWLETFEPSARAHMAAAADRLYGRIEQANTSPRSAA